MNKNNLSSLESHGQFVSLLTSRFWVEKKEIISQISYS